MEVSDQHNDPTALLSEKEPAEPFEYEVSWSPETFRIFLEKKFFPVLEINTRQKIKLQNISLLQGFRPEIYYLNFSKFNRNS
jgi:hypothetical protein